LTYLQVANTLFNFYYDIEDLESFNEIREKLEYQVNQLNFNTIEELNLSIKFNYNVAYMEDSDNLHPVKIFSKEV